MITERGQIMVKGIKRKALPAAVLVPVIALSAALSVNAQVNESVPLRVVCPYEYTDTYNAYLRGEVTVNEHSGTGIAKYSVPGKKLVPSGTLPSSYKTNTTGIRNQGGKNTCWAFSGIGTLEAFLSKQGKGNFDLSENHMAWWSTKYYKDDGTGWLNSNLSPGAYSITAMGYLASWQGPKWESDVPYTGYTIPDNIHDAPNAFNVTGITYVAGDIVSTKTAIINYGAVGTSYNSGQGYSTGRKAYYDGSPTTSFNGHAITIIGWDDNYSAENFDSSCGMPPADGAWLVKNSWGTSSSDNGYTWISYYDFYVLNTDTWGANYSITSARTPTGYDTLYQNEDGGGIYFVSIEDKNGNDMQCVTFANVFDFKRDNEKLDSVIFETRATDCEYTVYYIPVENDKPVTNRTKWNYIGSGDSGDSGYIRVRTPGVTLPKGKGAIAVEIDASKTGGYAQIGTCEWMTSHSGEYIYKPLVHKGDSFVITDNKAYDLLDIYAANNDDVGGTFVIKALTSEHIIGDIDGDGDSTVMDALLALRKSINLESFNSDQLIAADVNFDGMIDSLDSLTILRKSVKLISDF